MEQEIFRELVKLGDECQDAALITVISATGSTPREEGSKMLVRCNGSIIGTIGGGNVEALAIREALAAMEIGKSRRLSYRLEEGEDSAMACGGDLEIFIEPVLAEPGLFIFGGGHIGLASAKMAKLTGYKTTIIDDRPEFATQQRFPDVELVLLADFKGAFSKLTVRSSDYIVILTHAHKGDEIVLEQALKTKANYIGMIGSAKKNELVFSHLRNKGFSQDVLDKVYTPIGLRIRAQTPAEIAISILAEIIQIRRSNFDTPVTQIAPDANAKCTTGEV
jgi:xanthine dehydrogenase accessory factor